MKAATAIVCVAVALAACQKKPQVDVSAPKRPAVQTQSRSEPVFYNGANYLVRYDFNASAQRFDVKVSGQDTPLGAKDKTSAVNIATGAVRFFACPKGQAGQVSGTPSFSGGVWSMGARCV